MAKKVEPKEEYKPSLKALTLEGVKVEKLSSINQEGVLIDGGASHNVYYSATIPEGALERCGVSPWDKERLYTKG